MQEIDAMDNVHTIPFGQCEANHVVLRSGKLIHMRHVEGQQAEEAHPGLLPLCVQVEVKVPQPPVTHAGPQLQGRPQKDFEQRPLHNSPLLQLCLASWVPCCVFH